jgi:hypothetical protein
MMRLDSAMTLALTVAYDNNGNALTDSSGRNYSWDFENRLAGWPTLGLQIKSAAPPFAVFEGWVPPT